VGALADGVGGVGGEGGEGEGALGVVDLGVVVSGGVVGLLVGWGGRGIEDGGGGEGRTSLLPRSPYILFTLIGVCGCQVLVALLRSQGVVRLIVALRLIDVAQDLVVDAIWWGCCYAPAAKFLPEALWALVVGCDRSWQRNVA
jgi:hypothetical protein